VEAGHERLLATVFGEVTVARLAYRRRSCPNLHPADGALNLPAERYSHGLRELAATEAARGSFDGVVEAIEAATGQHLGKRQVEELAARAAVDFEAFYAQAPRPQAGPTDVVVLSADGKGIVMCPGALRPATAKAAAAAVPKLATRLSKGELWEISHNSPYGSAAVMRTCRARTAVVPGQGGWSWRRLPIITGSDRSCLCPDETRRGRRDRRCQTVVGSEARSDRSLRASLASLGASATSQRPRAGNLRFSLT
jgi:hypothetical protein